LARRGVGHEQCRPFDYDRRVAEAWVQQSIGDAAAESGFQFAILDAADALVGVVWARRRPALRTIWAVVAEPNRASRRVLEVNGFRLVGTRGVDERGDAALIYELELSNQLPNEL
jgi:hypothetical protein